MRVIVTHDFFETFGGAERTTAEIAAAFPDAEVYAVLGRRAVAARMGIENRVNTVLAARPRLLAHYRLLAPAYPAIVRSARLPEADVIVASSYAYAHAFDTPNHAAKVCYCWSPFRHVWSAQETYAAHLPGGRLSRAGFGLFAAAARRADRAAARSVQVFLTASPFGAGLIEAAYGRQARILPPPVDGERFVPSIDGLGDYFLFVGRLVEAYKRPSAAVEAFARMPDRRLLIAGDGPAMAELRRRATPNIEFLGHLHDAELVAVMQRCQAAIFPSVDDYGLVPLEVNACGRPVLAVRAGGPMHTVVGGLNGEFLADQSAAAIVEAVSRFDPSRYEPVAVRAHVLKWDRAKFHDEIRAAAIEAWELGRRGP
jgi:glycosyltransferase involved in cell wall biosynthesis